MSNLDTNKKHHNMCAIACTYRIEQENPEDPENPSVFVKRREMNLIIQSNKKIITYSDMNNARRGVITRMYGELDLKENAIMDIIFLNISYLGLMSEREFQGEDEEPQVVNAFN